MIWAVTFKGLFATRLALPSQSMVGCRQNSSANGVINTISVSSDFSLVIVGELMAWDAQDCAKVAPHAGGRQLELGGLVLYSV